MAGSNRTLNPNDVLFRQGDASDGMYLVRVGELKVYLQKDDKEVTLATINEGGMIGEMAFFENKPRSASVKATKKTEVTCITNDDFNKLLKQIPKWFVTIMQSLSSRLRQTNERLQKLEGMGAGNSSPYQRPIRILNVLNLMLNKDGVKEKNSWILERETVDAFLIGSLGEQKADVESIFKALEKPKLVLQGKSSKAKPCLEFTSRPFFEMFLTFLIDYSHKVNDKKDKQPLSTDIFSMIDCLKQMVEQSTYENTTIVFEDLMKKGQVDGHNTEQWNEHIKALKELNSSAISIVKASGERIGLKINKKDLPHFLRHQQLVLEFFQQGLI